MRSEFLGFLGSDFQFFLREREKNDRRKTAHVSSRTSWTRKSQSLSLKYLKPSSGCLCNLSVQVQTELTESGGPIYGD